MAPLRSARVSISSRAGEAATYRPDLIARGSRKNGARRLNERKKWRSPAVPGVELSRADSVKAYAPTTKMNCQLLASMP